MEASPRHDEAELGFGASRLLAAQPDAVLCKLAARGNAGAYEMLYQRHRASLVAFVFHLLGPSSSAEDAEDIVQDAFTRVFTGIREKRLDGSFKSWLYTIARNRTIDLQRTRRERVSSLDADAAEQPRAPQNDQPAERAEQRAELAWLVGAVAELPERQREALLMKEIGGLSHEGIASELGTTVSATKKLISRGRDGIDRAAVADGYRLAHRRLDRQLVLAAPVLPLAISLGALGVTAGAGAGGAAASKVAATALALIIAGGGAAAVEQRAAHREDSRTASRAAESPARVAASPAAFVFGPTSTRSVAGDDDDRDDDTREEAREDAREAREDAREDARERREDAREARKEAREARSEAREDARDSKQDARDEARDSEHGASDAEDDAGKTERDDDSDSSSDSD